jgi:hypothetical protein
MPACVTTVTQIFSQLIWLEIDMDVVMIITSDHFILAATWQFFLSPVCLCLHVARKEKKEEEEKKKRKKFS